MTSGYLGHRKPPYHLLRFTPQEIVKNILKFAAQAREIPFLGAANSLPVVFALDFHHGLQGAVFSAALQALEHQELRGEAWRVVTEVGMWGLSAHCVVEAFGRKQCQDDNYSSICSTHYCSISLATMRTYCT